MNRVKSTIPSKHTGHPSPRVGRKAPPPCRRVAGLHPSRDRHAIGQPNPELQQKLAAVKQSVAENQQKLHKYQWTETTQLTLNGDAKPPHNPCASTAPTELCRRLP